MKSTRDQQPSKSGFECVVCSAPVDSLYTSYFQQSNTSLLECPKCGNLADTFLSFPFAISLLDLLLLKPPVYRHLLRNRGGDTLADRRRHQAIETLRLAAITLSVDSLVRCLPTPASTDLGNVKLFLSTLGYCFLETSSLLVSIVLAAIILRRNTRGNLSDLFLLPLALFYSSLPTTFFLTISSIIWRNEYLPSPAVSSPSPSALLDLSPYLELLDTSSGTTRRFESKWANYLVSFSRANLKSGLAQIGSARGWASEALLRKGVGGSSAVIAVSVVLRISKRRAVAVLALSWAIHLVLLHAIDPFIT
ncbi:sterol homeostasis protein ARV1 [Sporobolomyces koalae]|uniref:sterol homeostasis protein ARV1 n=1 Tax=Sporobolomyces koalae TaxID=500713 RepID=UPI00317AA94E